MANALDRVKAAEAKYTALVGTAEKLESTLKKLKSTTEHCLATITGLEREIKFRAKEDQKHERWAFWWLVLVVGTVAFTMAFLGNFLREAAVRILDALAVLTRIQGREAALRELEGMEDLREAESGRFSEVFRPGIRFALLIAVTLAVLQQWTGVSVLSSYLPKIYQAAGYERISDAVWLSVLTYIFNLAMTAVAFWLVDKTGRRPLLLVGSAGMVLGLFCLGLVFFLKVGGIAVLLAMLLAQAAYLTSLAPVTWIVMSEIFPTRIRGRAMGIAALSLWIACFLGVMYVPLLMEAFEGRFGTPAGIFWLFAGVCVFAFWFCWKWVPETKGRTLEEIARSWSRE